MGTFSSMESSWLEPDDPPELPEGWWDEDNVKDLQDAVLALLKEPVYENGHLIDGISVRFLARLSILRRAAQLAPADDPFAKEAEAIFGADALTRYATGGPLEQP